MAFDSTSYSLLKTVVMMIGEYEFEGIFTEHDDPEHTERQEIEEGAKMIPFPAYSSLVFLGFVFVMSIVIMNLMVGLAVDDITEIQNNAELQKLSLNVSSTSDIKYSIDCGLILGSILADLHSLSSTSGFFCNNNSICVVGIGSFWNRNNQ